MDNKAHLWRAWWKEQVEPKIPVLHSLQMRLALGYSALIAALLILMNTYPLLMSQNLMFRSQQTALANQAVVITNALTTADQLTPAGVEQSLSQVEDLNVQRILITDGAGLVLYDSQENGVAGKYALTGEVVAALRGNDAFSSAYQDGLFSSRGAWPVMNRNRVVGAVCLYETDGDQGALLRELQRNLRLISVVVCLAVLALFGAFSTFLSRRVRTLLGGIRTVREGEYTHRISMSGHDELAQLAEEFNQLTGRLQVNEEERRRFVSDASHELKTPLASIRLLADSILQNDPMDPGIVRDFVTDIGAEADRLTRITEHLLALTRLDNLPVGKTEPVDVSRVMQRAANLLAPVAEAENVTVSASFKPDCIIACTEDDLYQICYNLIENAIKYNYSGGRVELSVGSDRDQILIEVRDTGVGIPEEDLPKIFNRFYRVDKARSRAAGGTGLGLSIVRDTVRRHGGWVTARNRHAGGSVFTVGFPRYQPDQGEEENV